MNAKPGVLDVMANNSHLLRNAGLPYEPLIKARTKAQRLAEALSNLIERFDSEIHNEYDGTSMLAERLAEADPARAALAAFNGEQP